MASPIHSNTMTRKWNPEVGWDDPEVQAYLESVLGKDRLQSISNAIATPPKLICLRVNTLKTTAQDILDRLPLALNPEDNAILESNAASGAAPYIHPLLPQAVLIPVCGPFDVDYSQTNGKEVVVGRKAGESMLKGANPYTPGILACSGGIEAGDIVAVSIGVEIPGTDRYGMTRGTVLDTNLPLDDPRLPNRANLFLGVGRALLSRNQMFASAKGQVLEMTQRVYNAPSLSKILTGDVMLQSLPSLIAAVVLDPKPGSKVLDMCASPGGKTTALAAIMKDEGEIIALDRSHTKSLAVSNLAHELGFTCVRSMKADSRKILGKGLATSRADPAGVEGKRKVMERKMARAAVVGTAFKPEPTRNEVCDGFDPETFDHILLDAPCSALGLRPRLVLPHTMEELLSTAQYQRGLLDVAVQLLKPGGTLVFSTCTISPLENENNVAWVLRKYAHSMKLVPQTPHLGETGVAGPVNALKDVGFTNKSGLSEEEAKLLQRFDPGDALDTAGFFIAKFLKTASC